ncbi:ABC transporter permease [Lachnospiraceae bacterium NSJ-29]|uniref:ABC transporter permease n=2 Tax=Wansuia hejianensis TaxID=2763667 RepID=A0A926IGW9_9FIRM|nr:ABC transporter permease [Wansuia hejianensis]
MYINFLKSEIKKWMGDSMMGFMIGYPIIFALLGRYFLPWLSKRNGFDFTPFNDLILVIIVLLVPIAYGALIGFSILEDRDDNVITNIRVTPLSLNHFLGFRLAAIYVLCVLATVFVMWFSDIGDLDIKNIIAISLLASLEAPISGLFINALAKNKIEGFAVMKAGGGIIIFPIVGLFFNNIKELFFSFAPGFWTAKSISSLIRGDGLYLSYNQYYFIGLAYMIILNIFAYKVFINKTRSE